MEYGVLFVAYGKMAFFLSPLAPEIKPDVRRLFVYRKFFCGYNKHDI